MKKLCILSICVLSSFVYANHDVYDNISQAIDDSAVVRVKSLVRSLNDLGLSQEEKREAIHQCVQQASARAEKHESKVKIVHNMNDMVKVLLGSFGLAGMNSHVLSTFHKKSQDPGWWVSVAVWYIQWGYILSKGIECYSQRKTLDKALRIKKWLEEQQGTIATS